VPGTKTIVSYTHYAWGPGRDEESWRGELLRWVGSRTQPFLTAPGTPVAVGEFRGAGMPGILARVDDGKYALLEPAAAKSPASGH